jgi:hypothetical protein
MSGTPLARGWSAGVQSRFGAGFQRWGAAAAETKGTHHRSRRYLVRIEKRYFVGSVVSILLRFVVSLGQVMAGWMTSLPTVSASSGRGALRSPATCRVFATPFALCRRLCAQLELAAQTSS